MTSEPSYSVGGPNRRIEGPRLVPLNPADDRQKKRSSPKRARKRRKTNGPVEPPDDQVIDEDLEDPETDPEDTGEEHLVDYLA